MWIFSPELFDPAVVDTETAAFNHQLETQAGSAPVTLPSAAALRTARRSGRSFRGELFRSPRAQTQMIPGPAGDIAMRRFVPDEVTGVYLYLHGGGWAIGGADEHDEELEALAQACRVVVLSVEYRLAPEYPYPAGPDDCEAAAWWLAQNAATEYGPVSLFIGGASAGAHLAVVTLLRLRDRHGFTGFAGANLAYGQYDLNLTPSARRWENRPLVLTTSQLEWFISAFAPPDLRAPDVSPLYADLKALPPALFTVGTLDPLLDDSLFMGLRWMQAGNVAELALYPGCIHGFTALPLALAEHARRRMHTFIRNRIASSTP